MQHSHNTTHTFESCSFLYIISSCRDRNPGISDGVYSKFFPRTISTPATHFTPVLNQLDQRNGFAPFGPFKLMQATQSKVMAVRAGAIVNGHLIPSQSTVTKTITEQTPYPELHSSRPGREF